MDRISGFTQYAAREHQQALDILDMEEPINKRLFEKYLKDESGLKDPSSDWEMSQSSVSHTVSMLPLTSVRITHMTWQT